MINTIHAILHRPESGWDPIPRGYAEQHARKEWDLLNPSLVDELEERIGGFRGKRVLDLGGGPGQYSVAFARKGALVTWHDISAIYRDIARAKAEAEGLEIDFSVGYMESATRLGKEFDFVFNRICWNYCKNDYAFARTVYDLVAPGGACFIDAVNDRIPMTSLVRRFQTGINRLTAWKVGHTFPPRGRVAGILNGYPLQSLEVDYSIETNDRILFRKPPGRAQ